MKRCIVFAAIACAISVVSLLISAVSANAGHLIIFPGPKSDTTPSGPVVDGLALSLTAKKLKRERPGHLWLSLELRNEGSQARFFLGLGQLEDLEAVVTDDTGKERPPRPYPKFDTDSGPSDSAGVPITPGTSAFLRVPIDAMVDFPKPGVYIVRLKSVRVLDARTRQFIHLVSNPLTVQIDAGAP